MFTKVSYYIGELTATRFGELILKYHVLRQGLCSKQSVLSPFSFFFLLFFDGQLTIVLSPTVRLSARCSHTKLPHSRAFATMPRHSPRSPGTLLVCQE